MNRAIKFLLDNRDCFNEIYPVEKQDREYSYNFGGFRVTYDDKNGFEVETFESGLFSGGCGSDYYNLKQLLEPLEWILNTLSHFDDVMAMAAILSLDEEETDLQRSTIGTNILEVAGGDASMGGFERTRTGEVTR